MPTQAVDTIVYTFFFAAFCKKFTALLKMGTLRKLTIMKFAKKWELIIQIKEKVEK